MSASAEAKSRAEANLAAFLDGALSLPQQVFRGAWCAYLFFNSDRVLNVPFFVGPLAELLRADGGACACMGRMGSTDFATDLARREFLEPGADAGRCLTAWFSDFRTDPAANLDSYGFASDSGLWCLYAAGQHELAVLALRDAAFQRVVEPRLRRLIDAAPIAEAAGSPDCHALGAGVRRKYLRALLDAYGGGGPMPPFVTRRTLAPGALSPRKVRHAKVLYPLLDGTPVCDTLVWDGPESLAALEYTFAAPPDPPSHRHFTILGGGEPVGALSIRPRFQPQRGDIGYWVGIPHQGKGYATAAVGEALRIAFAVMGMEKVEACAFVGNQASRRVLEKCGFLQEGLTRKAILKRGRWLDEWVFGITREDWISPGPENRPSR